VRGAPLVVVDDTLLDRDVTGQADRLSPEAPAPVVSGLRESAR
jgi:bifunctional ADP-heptose synthase (sugar kinase/adenylyltransferase)